MRLLFLIALCTGGILAIPAGLSAEVALDPSILDDLARKGEICVIVELECDSGKLPRHDVFGAQFTRTSAVFRNAQDRFLTGIPDGLESRFRFQCSPTVLLFVTSRAALEVLAHHPSVRSIRKDRQGSGSLDDARETIRANQVHDMGVTGVDRVVAVLDSGADEDHPSLEGKIIAKKRFLDQGRDVSNDITDGHGHGTHVSGIIVSSGVDAPRGVAPDASLVVVKVLNDQNGGWISDWARGVEHVIDLHVADNGIRVDAINMSLVSNQQYSEVCDTFDRSFSGACDRASALGIAVFVASGNTGRLTQISLPACFSSTIAVGSVGSTNPDEVSGFTSRSDLVDIVAPGERIESLARGGGSRTMTGTSQATPQVTAAALLLRQLETGMSTDDLRHVLIETGVPVFDPLTELTFPRLDCLASIRRLQLPIPQEFACEVEPAKRSILLSWSGISDIGGLELSILLDDQEAEIRAISSNATSYLIESISEGTLYEFRLRAVDDEFSGRKASCSILVPDFAIRFVRGDCNDDSVLDIADPIRNLSYLFSRADPPACESSCDSNDDGLLDISDSIYSLSYLFLGGAAPTSPFPDCEAESTGDDLGCVSSDCSS